MKFLVINDFNDINSINISHFSLDKGHFIAKSLSKNGHQVYFATTKSDYEQYGLNYISINKINHEFLMQINYILVTREPCLVVIMARIPAIREIICVNKKDRSGPKFIVKSDTPLWYKSKEFIKNITNITGIPKVRRVVKEWVIDHVDYICAQNNAFYNAALVDGMPKSSILISDMGISNESISYDKLINPYNINHSYCVNDIPRLRDGKAFIPKYYANNPNKINEFNTKKYIIVYTGRIKNDGGKILFNMKNIMKILGEQYELHVFPGSFYIPINGKTTTHSGKNANSLNILRNNVFGDSNNIIIHHPYLHQDKYRYLHFADCGIDFSDVRPKNTKAVAGHAKILEYCEIGLPVVCEKNIGNLYLIRNGKNGIILPYLASDEDYANAIRKIIRDNKVNRLNCRKITVDNENWDRKAKELVEQLS